MTYSAQKPLSVYSIKETSRGAIVRRFENLSLMEAVDVCLWIANTPPVLTGANSIQMYTPPRSYQHFQEGDGYDMFC